MDKHSKENKTVSEKDDLPDIDTIISIDEWMEKSMDLMKRMQTDEVLRKRISKKIS